MLVLMLIACGSGSEAGIDAAKVLAAADAHDGTEDHVVSECGGCGLAMKGDAAQAVEHEGYTLHFCSSSCKSGFEASPEKGVESLAKATE